MAFSHFSFYPRATLRVRAASSTPAGQGRRPDLGNEALFPSPNVPIISHFSVGTREGVPGQSSHTSSECTSNGGKVPDSSKAFYDAGFWD